ncbi:hypothetical protein EDB84DRAFT_1495553, partial [Lactarius hengduanensis]
MFQAHHLSYIRNQMASMLHALSSTFTTCACGSKAKDCALNLMAEFVDGRLSVALLHCLNGPTTRVDGPAITSRHLGPLVVRSAALILVKSCLSIAALAPATNVRQLMPPGSCRRKTTFYRITSTVGFRQQSIPYKSP